MGYPSPYGSHQSMVDDRYKALQESGDDVVVEVNGEKMKLAEDDVLLCDEEGLYVTKKNRLDTGLADPKRHNGRKKVTLVEEN